MPDAIRDRMQASLGAASPEIGPYMSNANRTCPSWLRCVILTGLLVGVTDYAIGFGIMVAVLGRPALGALQAPAAGVLGMRAFRGGIPTALLGTALHFVIATGWAAIFALLYRSVPAIRAPVARAGGFALTGIIAGCFIWIAMNDVFARLGRGRAEPFGTGVYWSVPIAHVVFVGIPLVWGTRRFAPPNHLPDVNHALEIA